MADPVDGWGRYFEELSSFIRLICRHEDSANENFVEFATDRLQLCVVHVSSLIDHLQEFPGHQETEAERSIRMQYYIDMNAVKECLLGMLQRWQSSFDQVQSSYSASIIHTAHRGRPRFQISKQQLEYLRSMSFKWIQIAEIIGVSYMTILRRRREFDMVETPGGNMTDGQLYDFINQLRREMPSLGQTIVWGRLRSQGFRVTRERVRAAMKATDPLHTAMRWRNMTTRHPYSVASPNSLWHIDGHHKLVRWRFVTHCGIDGYSRLIVFLQCSSNNRANTVYDLFLQAVNQYGLPSRVRCDQGKENIKVAQHMLHHRGIERRSILVGSSVHNQRIERLWRDSHRCVTSLYYRLFYYLEQNELLDPNDEENLFLLHYIFLPRINRSLMHFRDAWNNHGIRTERGNTPNQLFTSGCLRLQRSGLQALDFFQNVPEDYGVEENGLAAEDDEGVAIPQITYRLTQAQLTQLSESVHPLDDGGDDYGISLYTRALQIAGTWNT